MSEVRRAPLRANYRIKPSLTDGSYEIDDDASDSEPVAKKPKGLREERIEALKDKEPDPW